MHSHSRSNWSCSESAVSLPSLARPRVVHCSQVERVQPEHIVPNAKRRHSSPPAPPTCAPSNFCDTAGLDCQTRTVLCIIKHFTCCSSLSVAMSPRVAVLAAMVVLATGAPPPSRTRTPFNNDWRFARDLPTPPAAPCAPFPNSLNNVRCSLFTLASASGTTPEDCAGFACTAGVDAWQLDSGRGCWIGSSCEQNMTAEGFKGAARAPGSQPGPPCEPKGK